MLLSRQIQWAVCVYIYEKTYFFLFLQAKFSFFNNSSSQARLTKKTFSAFHIFNLTISINGQLPQCLAPLAGLDLSTYSQQCYNSVELDCATPTPQCLEHARVDKAAQTLEKD